MHSLRLPGETDQQFRCRAKRTALIAKHLIEAALNNYCIQAYIADPALPHSVASERANPTVRIDYTEAFAIAGIGEGLRATKHKHWGDGPTILPLEPDDPVDPQYIFYVFKEGSLYNRRFQQRRHLKRLLGRNYRELVSRAQYKRCTKRLFLNQLTDDEANAIRSILHIEPGLFWRMVRGKVFLSLPLAYNQLRLPFGDDAT